MPGHLIPDDRVRTAVIALVFASALTLMMLVGRVIRLGSVYRLAGIRPPRWWPMGLCAALWFFFFPNAPYIVTDFLHLKPHLAAPEWFDIVLMMSFAWLGLLLGYLSLMLMQEIVRARKGAGWSWCFAVIMLALDAFGIYLGRFRRFNTWDVLLRPHRLAGDALNRFDIHSNPEMFKFLLTFFCFSLLSYTTLHALSHLHHLPLIAAGGEGEGQSQEPGVKSQEPSTKSQVNDS